jgi:hypothetical protein
MCVVFILILHSLFYFAVAFKITMTIYRKILKNSSKFQASQSCDEVQDLLLI